MADFKQHMIINSVPDEECRIAILEDNRLEELYAESTSPITGADHVGNIYLGKVMNVEASIQAAFIDFGVDRNGFLHISDLHPMYFSKGDRESTERVGQKTPHRSRPPIQHCLKRGQEVVVQVLKEGIGTKGPTLTSYLSIPGRYLVMLPNMERSGVSRRLEDYEQRREMRQMLDSLNLPENFGFIMRTAAIDQPKSELKRDLAFLQRLWKAIENKRKTHSAPSELYCESDLLIRTIRDTMSPNVTKIIIDDARTVNRVREFLHIVTPRKRSTIIEHYDNPLPIFHHFGIEEQITQIHEREVPLPTGGTLVIDQTEAMVAIDVNSGKMRRFLDAETTAYKTNLEAVDEISRQLRLRDLGGLVLMDFIDMRQIAHQRDIENRLRDMLKRDRAKTEYLRISRFGIIEMTRQRMRPALRMSYYAECPTCKGVGHIKTADVCAKEAVRELVYLSHHPLVARIDMVISDTVAGVLLSKYRRKISDLEDKTGKIINIRISRSIMSDNVEFSAYDNNNMDLDISKLDYSKIKNLPSVASVKSTLMTQEVNAEDNQEQISEQTAKKPGRKSKRSRKPKLEATETGSNKAGNELNDKKAQDTKLDATAAIIDDVNVDILENDSKSVDTKETTEPMQSKVSNRRKTRKRRPSAKSAVETSAAAASKQSTLKINSSQDTGKTSTHSDDPKNKSREPQQDKDDNSENVDVTITSSRKKKRTRTSGRRAPVKEIQTDTISVNNAQTTEKFQDRKSENKINTPKTQSDQQAGVRNNSRPTETKNSSIAASSETTNKNKFKKTKSRTKKAAGKNNTQDVADRISIPKVNNDVKSRGNNANNQVQAKAEPNNENTSPTPTVSSTNKKRGRLYQTRRRLSAAQVNQLITDED